MTTIPSGMTADQAWPQIRALAKSMNGTAQQAIAQTGNDVSSVIFWRMIYDNCRVAVTLLRGFVSVPGLSEWAQRATGDDKFDVLTAIGNLIARQEDAMKAIDGTWSKDGQGRVAAFVVTTDGHSEDAMLVKFDLAECKAAFEAVVSATT